MSYYDRMKSIDVLVGKTIEYIEQGYDSILFQCTDGKKYRMQHRQDCCENVYVESVVGDLNDLIGQTILSAEERTSEKNPVGVDIEYQESFTWTFYSIRCVKASIDIRWYGESNGYYSESVDFVEIA